jgi:hypothetical protein
MLFTPIYNIASSIVTSAIKIFGGDTDRFCAFTLPREEVESNPDGKTNSPDSFFKSIEKEELAPDSLINVVMFVALIVNAFEASSKKTLLGIRLEMA